MSAPTAPEEAPLHRRLADTVARWIAEGVLRPGEKAPSLRKICRQQGVSMSTAIQAFLHLEDRGLVEARPRSGFFIKSPARPVLNQPSPGRLPITGTLANLHASLFEATTLPGIVSLGGAVPSPELLPTQKLNRILAARARTAGRRGVAYDMPPGSEVLRREICKRMLEAGATLAPHEVMTTCGGTEALMLCLRAVTRPGDAVAVETPTYFGVLHAMDELGLRAVEIPVHETTGLDLDALERALNEERLAACVVVPNFSNPCGALMPDANKARLARLLAARDVPLIEDDVFGELYHGATRPHVVKAYDENGLVLLCGSFSKSLAPGYRVGWVAAGRYQEKVRALKLTHTLATATLPELAVAEFLANGGYDHYLRSARRTYAANVKRMRRAILAAFPAGTRVSDPAGGFVLWVEMPPQVDAVELYTRALAQNISIAPGPMFSASEAWKHHIRISCGEPWSERVQDAVKRLGALASRAAA